MRRCKGRVSRGTEEGRLPAIRGDIWHQTLASLLRNAPGCRLPCGALAGITCMRRVLGFVLFVAASLAVLTGAARAQTAPSSVDAATCLGFSFGPWTPPLDWRASGHERTPESITVPLAPGGRGWAAATTQLTSEGTMLLFPSWWPVGVKVTLPPRTLAPGDTVEGRAIALVANGFVTPPSAEVRAWLVPCGASRRESTTRAPTSNDRLPTGTWRGTSTCLARQGRCGEDSVVYRIGAISGAPDSVSLAASTIGARGERPTGELRCRYDAFSAILSCDVPAGVLRLAVRGTELGGRLTRRDGVDLRYVYVRRTGR
jgi:hypothetical protein